MNELEKICQTFLMLNPDIAFANFPQMKKLTKEFTFDDFEDFTENVIEKYLNSPLKIHERKNIEQYIFLIEKTTQKLLKTTIEKSNSLALNYRYSENDWLKVLENSKIPQRLDDSMNAIISRKIYISGVTEILFDLFFEIDFERAINWQKKYLAKNPFPDFDILRDLILSWQKIPHKLPNELLNYATAWSESEVILRLWHSIQKEVNKLLQLQALAHLPNYSKNKNLLLRDLEKIKSNPQTKSFLNWNLKVLEKITDLVFFFSELEVKGKDFKNRNHEIFQLATIQSLLKIKELFLPLIININTLFEEINGAEKVAFSFLGFAKSRKNIWDNIIFQKAQKTVRRLFLNDLKNGDSPDKTIQILCFGNENMLAKANAEIDLKKRQFDSISQREKVEKLLAYNYASFRNEKLLNDEIARRYRRFIKMLHIDNLRLFLKNEQIAELGNLDFLQNYLTITTAARKFIATKRNCGLPAEEAFAAKEEFIKTLQQNRIALIRQIL